MIFQKSMREWFLTRLVASRAVIYIQAGNSSPTKLYAKVAEGGGYPTYSVLSAKSNTMLGAKYMLRILCAMNMGMCIFLGVCHEWIVSLYFSVPIM